MAKKTLKDRVDDLTSELKSAKERAEEDVDELISKIELLREQAAKQSSELIGSIEETAEDMASSVREKIEELKEEIAERRRELEKERENKKAFGKSIRFYAEGISAFKEKNFSRALEYFTVARSAAEGVTSPVFKENGLTAAFNASFLLAKCFERLNRSMEALDVYYQLHVGTSEDSDYQKLFVVKTLDSMLNACAKKIWDSWPEERKEKIRQATNLSIELESGAIPNCFSPDWRVVYILSLFVPEFKDFCERFNEINRMHDERKAFLDENKQKIAEVVIKIRALSQQKEDLERSRKFEENAQPSFRPKDFSGAGMGWLVGFLMWWLGGAVWVATMSVGPTLLFLLAICIFVGIIAASVSKAKKFRRALDEFLRQKQQKVSEKIELISQVEPEINNWRERKSQLEKWHEDNRILVVGGKKQ
ncbi:MAG: hypothetical protein NTV24_05135 [Candidatus Woesebacteria bacterium]|nr:hypothetical protein [Candidatus Woesebacteria bacterium]